MKCLYRGIAILLCAVMCGSLCSCALYDRIEELIVPTPSVRGIPEAEKLIYTDVGDSDCISSSGYTPLTCRYAYGCLGEGERALYDALLPCVTKISVTSDEYGYPTEQAIIDGFVLSDAEIAVTIRALCDDNPYLFWLPMSYSSLTDENADYTAVRLYSMYAPGEVVSMKGEVDAVLTSFYAGVPEGLSRYDRELFAHDYLIGTVDYDEADLGRTGLTPENLKSHSVYGALVEKLCVCEGYGTAMQLLLNGLGVDCVTLTGEAYHSTAKESEDQTILHLWNAVKLDDGRWYHVDPTWDDQENAVQQYNYFNLDDEAMFADHTLSLTPGQLGEDGIEENGVEALNFFVPSCDAATYNFYVYEYPHLTGYDAYMLDDSLLFSAESRDEYYIFYVEPTLDYQEAIDVLFKDDQTFFDLIVRVNDRLEDCEIDSTNVTYYLNEPRRSIAVQLKYY